MLVENPTTTGSGVAPAENDAQLTRTIRVGRTGNFTVLLPMLLGKAADYGGWANYTGPRSSGFTMAYFLDGSPPILTDAIKFAWEIPEFSRLKAQRQDDGSFSETCWSGRQRSSPSAAPCDQRIVPRDPVVLRDAGVGTFPSGYGYLLLAGETNGSFDLTLELSEEVLVAPPIDVSILVQKLGAESFDARYQAIERCVEIAWCGTIVEGTRSLVAQANHVLFIDVFSKARGSAFVEVCLESMGNQEPRDCGKIAASPPSIYHSLRATIPANSPPWRLAINATSPPGPEAATQSPGASFFVVHGEIHQFQLPGNHPLR